MDVLSTDEGDDDDSDDKLSVGKEYFDDKKEKDKTFILNLNNEQNSIILQHSKPCKSGIKNKKLNNVKSSKNLNYAFKKYGTDKKNGGFTFKRLNFQNISSINKKLNVINPKNNNQNKNVETNVNKKNNNISNNSVQNFNINQNNKEVNNNKSTKDIKANKINKIHNYQHLERNNKNGLPHISSPRKRRELNIHQFSFNNDIENYNIVPIILPNIDTIKNFKNQKYEAVRKSCKIKKKNQI